MGREVRRVHKDWQHPRNDQGHHIPLFDGRKLAEHTADWDVGAEKWEQGFRRHYGDHTWVPKGDECEEMPYSEWAGERPDPRDYMPEWSEEERTHLQMYENTTEGTPISPVMENPEDLARWLADNYASASGIMTATYDQWLSMIGQGWAVSLVTVEGQLMSGVEASGRKVDSWMICKKS